MKPTVQYLLAILFVAFCSNLAFGTPQERMTPVVRVAKSAKPCVVNIQGRKTVRNTEDGAKTSFKQVNGMGTGVFIDERGYILTNYHVVDGVARIQIKLSDSTNTTARLIAHDPRTDLAILKIDLDRKLPVIKMGTSSDLMEGESVIAIGNAFGYSHTVTEGIISSLHRNVPVSETQVYYDLIQTSCAINPGNSGGPLLNIKGDMIGINAAVRVGAQSIAFTIPLNAAVEIAARLIRSETKDFVSVDFETMTDYVDHQPVVKVRSISAANKSGLKVGDIILSVNGYPVSRQLDFERRLIGTRSGHELQLEVDRAGEKIAADIKIGGRAATVRRQGVNQAAWEMLGITVQQIPENEFRSLTNHLKVGNKLRGGMRIVQVRPNGPAATQSIRAGDILVGMHDLETTSDNDLSFILKEPAIVGKTQVKYFVLRGESVIWGHIHMSSRSNTINR